jgi:peptide/nickel transport system substrate-binding protein
MKHQILCICVLAFVTLSAEGCRQRAAEVADYQDSHPVPAEPLIRQVATVGRHGGRFVLGQTVNPKSFNGLTATETSSTDITDRIFTFLVDYDNATQQFGPLLAKSWEVAPDGITWTFHLRKGAAFSDGHPITAEDVLFSFDVVYDDLLHPPIQEQLEIGGEKFKISAPDPYTVVINTLKPNSALLDALVTGNLAIMPKHVLEALFKAGTFGSAYNVSTPPEKLVTSGAWRLVQYVPGEKTVLGRNPYYFGYDQSRQRLPYLDEMIFLIVPDQDAADLKFRSGELDGLDNVKPENYRWYEDNQTSGNYTLYDLGPSQSTQIFWFNLNKVQPPRRGEKPTPGKKIGEPFVDPVKYAWFNNPIFRRAVSMAVDREALIRSVFFGYGEKNWSQQTKSNKEWHYPDLIHYDHNPEEAKKLLSSLGFRDTNADRILEDSRGNQMSFAMKTNADNAIRVAMANFIRDDLAKVGIRMVLNPVDFNTLITNLRSDFQYETILLGFQSGVPPSPFSGQNVYRSSGESHNWFIRQQKPETPQEARVDQILDEMLVTQDRAAQKRLWNEAQTIMSEQAWFIWLPILKVKIPMSNRFGNVQPSIMAHRLIWNIDRVYVKRRDS